MNKDGWQEEPTATMMLEDEPDVDVVVTDLTYNYAYLSERRYYWYFFLQVSSASLSLVGSVLIIYLIVAHWRKRWEVYHRLLLALSLADVIFDGSILFQFPLVRRDATYHPLAIGNTTSCTTIGFITTWSFSTVNLLFVVLSVYFLMTVRYGKHEHQVRRYIEPYGYIFAIGLPLAICIAALYYEAFNPVRIVPTCFMRPYPTNCYVDKDVDCERGGDALGLFVVFLSSAMSTMLLGICCTWLVYWTVRRQQRRNLRHSFRGHPTTRLAAANRKRMRMIANQAFCYTAVFMNGIVTALFCTQLETMYAASGVTRPDEQVQDDRLSNNTILTVGVSLYLFLCPLQGLLNLIIYVRPSYLVWREQYPHQTRWWAFRQILHGKQAMMTPRMSHLVDGNVNEETKLDSQLDRYDTSRTLQHSSWWFRGPRCSAGEKDARIDVEQSNDGGDSSPPASYPHQSSSEDGHRDTNAVRVSFSACTTDGAVTPGTTCDNQQEHRQSPALLIPDGGEYSSNSSPSYSDDDGSDDDQGGACRGNVVSNGHKRIVPNDEKKINCNGLFLLDEEDDISRSGDRDRRVTSSSPESFSRTST
jgi:hypothetical protein